MNLNEDSKSINKPLSVEDKICSEYRYKSLFQLSDENKVSIDEVRQILRQYSINKKRFIYSNACKDWLDEVQEYYKNHSLNSTAEYFFVSTLTIQNILKSRNINPHTAAENQRLSRNEHYGSVENSYREGSRKSVQTNIQKYGVDNPAKTNNVKQKVKESFLTKYGVDNPMKLDSVKAKYRENMITSRGVSWPMQDKGVLKKREQTNKTLYGGSGFKSKQIKDKLDTIIESRYGVDNVSKCQEIKTKISETCKQRYGVDWFCMSEECRKHSTNNSLPNSVFANLLDKDNIAYQREFSIGKYSYDFKIRNILVEINPTPTHNIDCTPYNSEKGIDPYYHKNKTDFAIENGYRCIHVWDWDNPIKVINTLKQRHRVFARDCQVKEITKQEAKDYINSNHLQGYARDSIRLGLYCDNLLVSCMTFGKPRYNKNYEYELVRYCSTYQVVGGAEKLFKYFVKNNNPKSIISYCDNSKFQGDVYYRLHFKKYSQCVSKHWYNIKTNKHITDNLLRQRGFDQLFGTTCGKGTDNETLMREYGFVPVFDAGQTTFVWSSL